MNTFLRLMVLLTLPVTASAQVVVTPAPGGGGTPGPANLIQTDANTLAVQNGVNPQRFDFYSGYTNVTDYGRLSIFDDGANWNIATQGLAPWRRLKFTAIASMAVAITDIYGSAPEEFFRVDNSGITVTNNGRLNFIASGLGSGGISAGSNAYHCWSDQQNPSGNPLDTCLGRASAGVVKFRSGNAMYTTALVPATWQAGDPGAARPTCDADVRGTYWHTFGGAGVADGISVCVKNVSDAYVWQALY